MRARVDLSRVRKKLRRIPLHIAHKVQIWADQVEKEGLLKVQQVPSYKDHSLKGNRKGQRSVYLNRSWRLIYTVIFKHDSVAFVDVKEISHHEY